MRLPYVPVEVVECLRCICPRYLSKYNTASWVGVYEVCHIVHFVVNDYPEIVFVVVLRDLLTRVERHGEKGMRNLLAKGNERLEES